MASNNLFAVVADSSLTLDYPPRLLLIFPETVASPPVAEGTLRENGTLARSGQRGSPCRSSRRMSVRTTR